MTEPLGRSWATTSRDDSRGYPTVEAFVTEYLAPIIRRPTAGRCWCPSWWAHPEAVWRLTALWNAWEALTVDHDTGASSWWLHHLDPHLRVLFDRAGPFAGCRGSHTDTLQPLPVTPGAPVWFEDRDRD